ncbi:MAG: putative motility protein [Phycisphaeraceae bacterium]
MTNVAASSMSQAQVQQEVAFAVARKALDNVKAQGDAALSLLASAAEVQQSSQTQRPLGPGQTINVVA